MKKIQMVDLQSQYTRLKSDIDAALQEVITSAAFVNGPEVLAFREELESYLGAKHVIPCANGTDALQVALMGLGLKPGDEVITPDFTFAATVEVIALLGLIPVLVDVEADTFNISTDAIKKAITPKTKAIIPVHLFGQSANMDRIMAIAKTHNLYVVEDNAQGIGATYTFSGGMKMKTGTIGHVGTTSFFPSKNLGCYGDGGALFTNDDDLAYTLRGIVNHGMYKRYYHDVVGVNSRLDSMQAAVLRIKLRQLDNFNKKRREAADKYDAAFLGNEKLKVPFRYGEAENHVFHQYTLKVIDADRNALQLHLNQKGIPCGIYYPVPLHLQKAYRDVRYKEEDFQVTNMLVDQVISLPMHTELDDEQIKFITNTLIDFVD